MANGENEGIAHSFRVTNDAFAQGDNRLVNHKTYYFVVLAYGYNNYEEYDPILGAGQDVQYKASRKVAVGSIRTYAGILYNPAPESGGLIQYAEYGDGVEMTRLEGKGNGTNDVELTATSEQDILANTIASTVTYQGGMGPVTCAVIDPRSRRRLRAPRSR